MALIRLAEIEPILVCPRCRSPLRKDPLRCSSPFCRLAVPDSFPSKDGRPALVDFEHSVLDPPAVLSGEPTAAPRRSVEGLPRWLASIWKPVNKVAERNVAQLLSMLPPRPLVLVVGGGTVGNGTADLYRGDRARVVSFDIYPSRNVQLIADAHSIPLADGSIDAVIVQAVLEHVLEPSRVVAEIHRVLRPDGLVYAETPFLQPVHAGPYDFTRFTASGHRYLFKSFTEVEAGVVAGPGSAVMLALDHLTRGIFGSVGAGKIVRGLFLWLRYLDPLVPVEYGLDSASANFFLGRRAEADLTPRDIVAYYPGAQ